MKFGVLALQGDFREHISALKSHGIDAIEVRNVSDLNPLDALVIPGGESTTISMLCESTGLDKAISEKINNGLYVYGSCAGMILLATEILDGRADQISFDAIDISVRRNGFGRQIDSFEAEIFGELGTHSIEVFIRAPKVESVGTQVQILGSVSRPDGVTPVMVRQNRAIATSFHPELGNKSWVHKYFIDLVQGKVS